MPPETGTTTPPETGTTPPPETGDQTPPVSLEEQLKAAQESITKLEAALKKANSESAKRRVELEALKQQLTGQQGEEVTPGDEPEAVKKLRKENDRWKKQAEQAVAEARALRLTTLVERLASKVGYQDRAAVVALKLGDWTQIDVAADDAEVQVEELLKEILKEYPYLAKPPAPAPRTNATDQGKGSGFSVEDATKKKRTDPRYVGV